MRVADALVIVYEPFGDDFNSPFRVDFFAPDVVFDFGGERSVAENQPMRAEDVRARFGGGISVSQSQIVELFFRAGERAAQAQQFVLDERCINVEPKKLPPLPDETNHAPDRRAARNGAPGKPDFARLLSRKRHITFN